MIAQEELISLRMKLNQASEVTPMEKYMRPEMEVELFLNDVITDSTPGGCENELPILPFEEGEESDFS